MPFYDILLSVRIYSTSKKRELIMEKQGFSYKIIKKTLLLLHIFDCFLGFHLVFFSTRSFAWTRGYYIKVDKKCILKV